MRITFSLCIHSLDYDSQPCFQILTSCFTFWQFLCNFKHPPPDSHLTLPTLPPGVSAILTYTIPNLCSCQTCNFQTPTGESLTFVVTLLDQVTWLYSGYCYSSPTMISIINRVLGTTFLAIHCFEHSRCHPPSRHSIVDTLCRTSGPCSRNPG